MPIAKGPYWIVFQNPDIQLFNSSVDDELVFGLTQLGLPRPEIERRLKEYIDLMDIGHLLQRHPQQLSIGEKKRVAKLKKNSARLSLT